MHDDNPSTTSKCPVKTVAEPIWRDRTSRKVDRWRGATDTSRVAFHKGGLYRYYRVVKRRFSSSSSPPCWSSCLFKNLKYTEIHESTSQQSTISKIVCFSRRRCQEKKGDFSTRSKCRFTNYHNGLLGQNNTREYLFWILILGEKRKNVN